MLELKRLFVANDHALVLEIREPTLHEQLEASLRLRAWLAQHGA